MTPLLLLAFGVAALAGAGLASSSAKKARGHGADDNVRPHDLDEGFAAAQRNAEMGMRAVANRVPGSVFAGALLAAASAVAAGNLPNRTESMSGAMVAVVTMLYAQQTDPAALRAYADALERIGLTAFAKRFRDRAAVVAKTPAASAAGVPPALQQAIAAAEKLGTPEAYSSVAYQLEEAGFPEAARVYRDKASAASKARGTPPAGTWPNQTLNPQMPPELASEVARVLRDSADPKVLDALAIKLRELGYSATADQVAAKAAQVRGMLDAATAMQKVDTVMKSPTLAKTLPEEPSGPLPTEPLPQPAPIVKTKEQVAAENMQRNLFATVSKYGSVRAARTHEDMTLVKKLQTMLMLTVDGKYGPKTALSSAKYIDKLAPVFWWPKTATTSSVAAYHSSLETLALDAEQQGKTDRANELRASAAIDQEIGIGPGEHGK